MVIRRIPYTTKNRIRIEKYLGDVQKRCSRRLIDYDDVESMIEVLEERLSIILYKVDWVGLSITLHSHSQNQRSIPASYNGVMESTHVQIMRKKSSWTITDIYRAAVVGRSYTIDGLDLKMDALLKKAKNYITQRVVYALDLVHTLPSGPKMGLALDSPNCSFCETLVFHEKGDKT